MTYFFRVTGLLCVLAACLGLADQASAQADDAEKLRGSIKRAYQNTKPAKEASRWAAEIKPDGRWSDINYADKSPSSWQLEKQLDRAIDIARTDRGNPAAISALRHWFRGGYRNPNWWYQEIGMPRRLLELAYLLDEELPAGLRDTLDRALDVFDAGSFAASAGSGRMNILNNLARVMLWRRDSAGIDKVFELIEAEAGYAPLEDIMYDHAGGLDVRNSWLPAGRGFQYDMTFHHRGDRVDYTLSYGMVVYEQLLYWNNRLKGTRWEFKPESKAFIDRFLDDCARWHLVRDSYIEPAAYGRDLARPVKSRYNWKYSDPAPLSGARYFPQSAYFAFKRPLYESAVLFHSRRNANQEAAHNKEGIHNHYRGDGACHLTVDGNEYLNIWPVFDFRKIPGVTSPLTPYSEMPPETVQLTDSPIEFAGAVTDDEYGAVALDFSTLRSDLRARKSWFFFDEGYVCLGSGIHSTSGDTIVTTVEQCLSPVEGYTRRANTILHNGNAYEILEGKAEVRHGRREGAWANCVLDSEQSKVAAADTVFEIVIDHGRNPKGEGYACAVKPGTPRTGADPAGDWFRILERSDKVHAVESKDGKLVYAVFFEPSSVKTSAGKVAVQQPCIMMVRDGQFRFSDPTHSLYRLDVSIDGKSHRIKLPTWQKAGTSVKL